MDDGDGAVDGDGDGAVDGEGAVSGDGADPLVAWCLGAFHAAGLVAVAIWLLHAGGSLGNLLGGLNTAVGLVLYTVLWALSWVTTRMVLARIDVRGSPVDAVVWGALGGAGTGVAFLLVVVVPVVIANLLTDPGILEVLPFVLGAGGTVALLVGTVLGGLFAVVDLALIRIADVVSVGGDVDERPSG